MTPPPLQDAFKALQQNLQRITTALAGAEPQELVVASEVLRSSSMDLLALVQRLTRSEQQNPHLKHQVGELAVRLSLCRENLIRRSAMVERMLQNLVPSSGKETYAMAASPYAKMGRQSTLLGMRAA